MECICTICNGTGSSSYDSETKIEVKLQFYRKELLYDVENLAFVEGDLRKDADEHVQHAILDIGQTGNIDRVTRVLNLVHAAAIEILYPYTKTDVVEETVHDKLWQPDIYQIIMKVPQKFSQTTIHLLSRLIHEYMVARVLADWLSITCPDAAKKYFDMAAALLEDINKAKNHRAKTFERPLAPF